jgi:hypothetical protein
MLHVVYEAATGKDRAFRDAAGRGNLGLVTSLLVAGQSVESMSKYGATALHKAAGAGELPVVQLLVERGANVHKIHKGGKNPLQEAESRGFTEVVDYLRESMQPKESQLALVGKEMFVEALAHHEHANTSGVGGWFAVIRRLAKLAKAYAAKDVGRVKYSIQKLMTAHAWFMEQINAMDLPSIVLSCGDISEINRRVRDRLTRALPAAGPSDDGTVQVFLPGVEGAMTTYTSPEAKPLFSRLEYYAGVKMPSLVRAGRLLFAFTELRSPVGNKPLDVLGNVDDRAPSDLAWKVSFDEGSTWSRLSLLYDR